MKDEWKLSFKFEPRDIWIGLFWDKKELERAYFDDVLYRRSTIDIYICPLPCLRFHWRKLSYRRN